MSHWNMTFLRQPVLLLLVFTTTLLFSIQPTLTNAAVIKTHSTKGKSSSSNGAIGLPPTSEPEKILFEDDFNGPEINRTLWNFDLGDGCDRGICGWGNWEKQIYTRDAATCVDGVLRITAKRHPTLPDRWTSARLTTNGTFSFLYGRIQVRVRMPLVDGSFGAVWLLPRDNAYGIWPNSGEIDVIEAQTIWKTHVRPYRLRTPGTLHFATHYNGESLSFWAENNDPREWHIYTTIWRPDGIFYEIDGRSLGGYRPTSTDPDDWPFNQPFFLNINLAVDPQFGSKSRPETKRMVMEVDWIRISEL
jgi:beta-glucanase (GH16 family)